MSWNSPLTKPRAILSQERFEEADTLYRRVIQILEEASTSANPDLAVSLSDRAGLLQQQVRCLR